VLPENILILIPWKIIGNSKEGRGTNKKTLFGRRGGGLWVFSAKTQCGSHEP